MKISQEHEHKPTHIPLCELLPKGLLIEPTVKGADHLERYLGLKFDISPLEVVYNPRNRVVILLSLRSVAPSQKLDFLLGKSEKQTIHGFYHLGYHTVFTWEEDRDMLDEKYLHELVHAYCYQPGKAWSNRTKQEDIILRTSSDQALLSSLIETRITNQFISEGLAVWGASTVLYRESLFNKGIIDADQYIRDTFKKQRSPLGYQDEWFAKIIPVALANYRRAITYTGKKRAKAMEKADRHLSQFWYSHSFIFIRDTIDYMISEGMPAQTAFNALVYRCPQTFSEIQGSFELAESLLNLT